MQFIGALDQGTSSTRFMIFTSEGSVIGQHQVEHRQILPSPGWVEHDASEIWERTKDVITGALAKAGISGKDLAGDRKSTRLNSSHVSESRMPSSA